jgi:AAA15 family ATPase/GTPase
MAGENNTGKSTFGKVLYCMFSAFCNSEEAIHNERVSDIVRRVVSNIRGTSPIFGSRAMNNLINKFIEETKDVDIRDLPEGTIEDIIKEYVMDVARDSKRPVNLHDQAIVDDAINSIKHSLAIHDDEIQKAIINRYFRTVFEGKISHVNKKNIIGDISLVVQKKNINVYIQDNKCNRFVDNVGIRHEAIYVDTPFVIDDIQTSRSIRPIRLGYSSEINHRLDLRHRLERKYSSDTVIEEVITSQKITNVLSNLYSITNGEFREGGMGDLMFLENGLSEPIPFCNISTGLKAFLVLRRLLELGEIKERDVLIFDEPEIHLHPSWQLQFAEILVLLQKEFNLTILLATHSPYFLNAIEVYSEKHGIKEERVKFYLAENNGNTSDVLDVTDDTEAIYKQLAAPLRKLDDMEYGD